MFESLIQSPDQIKNLSLPELQILAEDIRQTIISVCLKNGGHIGASLGAVELAIALHRVFHSPQEPLVWDVGHQAYAHKLLTGRWKEFSSLRQFHGVSGFLKRDESPHDAFGAGHSSTAISAALGMAWAKGKGSTDWTVAIVGDGGLTAGLCFEGLNNFRNTATGPLLIVLNDNQMSISQNVGAISSILAENQSRTYFNLFGCEYIGPVDGHDLGSLISELERIRKTQPDKPIVLHALTLKGKGYSPAEEQPAFYHGISPIQKNKTPAGSTSTALPPKTYSQVLGDSLCHIAEGNPKVVAITAAMPDGTGLIEYSQKHPDRFFDVGIAEGHAVTFAAGLATQGIKPVVAIYSTFLQRAIDSVIHDVAIQKLGVVLALDRAGIVGADGPTHHGVFDLSYLGMIPGMTVSAPSCLDDLRNLLREATQSDQPWAIRYPRGSGPEKFEKAPLLDHTRFHQTAPNPKLILVGLGATAERVRTAALEVDPDSTWITAISTVLAKPIPRSLTQYLERNLDAQVISIEDGVKIGGFGQRLQDSRECFEILAYGDHFIPHGSPAELEDSEGVSKKALLEKIRKIEKSEKSRNGKKTS
jgi:1-deoxy-D-xylulose-5-phosphate synthase